MATQTLTTADAILKNVYRGVIVELLNQETYLIDKVEKQNASDLGNFDGRQLVIALHTARNRGRGIAADGGALATAGTQSYQNAFVPIHYFNQGIELTDLIVKQTQTNEGSFVRALGSEMDRAMTDVRKEACRMAYGTGDGLLATWVSGTGTGASTTIVVDNAQYIGVGDVVDFLTKSSGAVKQAAATVTAVTFNGTKDSSTQAQAQVTLSTVGVAGASGDGLYIAGDRNAESDGLRNITNTGRTLHQINSTTYPIWDGNVISPTTAYQQPNEDLFMQLAQQIQARTGKRVGSYVTTLGIQRRLALQYISQKRINDAKAVEIPGGYSSITVSAGGRPVDVVADTFAVNGFAFALPQDETFAWAELARPDWLLPPDGKGSVLHLKDGSSAGGKVATWQAWVTWPAGLACIAPNRTGQLNQLADDKPIVYV